MFGDLNEVTLLGNVTKDPDLRYTPGGSAVISFSLATNRRYKKDENWVDEPSFHNIVVWNQAEQLSQRIKKGTRMLVQGRIQTRSWDGADGKKQYKTEVIAEKVILISRFEGDNSGNFDGSSNQSSSSKPGNSGNYEDESIDPSDLPF